MPVVVATANVPVRLGPHRADVQRLADEGADIIVTQEEADRPGWTPRGWRRHRPRRARSVAIYWNPATVTRTRRGAKRLSAKRYGVWCHFRTPDGPLRVMAVHLPAFYNRPANRRSYDRQVRTLARWVRRGPNRVLAGDLNGTATGQRLAPLAQVARFSKPVPSGPKGQPIDYVAASKRGPWKPAETRIMARGRSDHRPVMVTLAR